MIPAKHKRAAFTVAFILTALVIVATVVLVLLAIWTGDDRFAETAFLSFILIIVTGGLTVGIATA